MPGVAPPRSLLVGRWHCRDRSGSASARARSAATPCGVRRDEIACPSVAAGPAPEDRSSGSRAADSGAAEGAVALAPSPPELCVLGMTLTRAVGPSCEFASSITSRDATPAMALLRFSTPWRLGPTGPPCGTGAARTVVRGLRPARAWRAGSTWRLGYPRPPRRASPFRAFPPSQVGAGYPVLAFLGLPAPALPAWSRGPFKALIPGRSAWPPWSGWLLALLGFSPSGPCVASRWLPVGPGCLLLHASCVVARRRRRPASWSLARR